MARKVRIEYPGAVYHVMSRGDQGGPIFHNEADRELFLGTLSESCLKTGWQVHAYVLMGNHYHLLLETPEANLVAGMKWLQGTYTQRFNRRHAVSGHLFQGRYKAVLVDEGEDEYFQVVSTYIHLNAARAGLIRMGEEPLWKYLWSSYPAYLRRASQRPSWLRVDRVLGSLGINEDNAKGRKDYEVYVEGRALELRQKQGRETLNKEWEAVRNGWYLGEDGFRERLEADLKNVVKGKARQSFSGDAKRAHDEATAEGMLEKGLATIGLTGSGLATMPKGALEKQVLAWWLRQRTTVSRQWVAQRLCMGDESRVNKAVAAVKNSDMRTVRRLAKRLERLDA